MFCSECGAEIKSEVRFCGECGAPVESANTEETPALAYSLSIKKSDDVPQSKSNHKIKLITIVGVVAIVLIGLYATGLSKVVIKEKYPEAYGIYLIHPELSGNAKYQALKNNEDIKTIGSEVDQLPSILVFDKSIASDNDLLKIRSGTYVRKFRKNDQWKGNLPVQNFNSWMVIDDHTQELRGQFKPIPDHPDMLMWTPTGEVKAGLYYISIHPPGLGRKSRELEPFFYQKNAVMSNLQQSDHCVDFYQYFMSPERRFYPCKQNYNGN